MENMKTIEEDNNLDEIHWLAIWKAAIGRVPPPIKYILGFIFFIIQVIASHIILKWLMVFLSNPIYAIFALFCLLLLLLIAISHSIKQGREEIEKDFRRQRRNREMERTKAERVREERKSNPFEQDSNVDHEVLTRLHRLEEAVQELKHNQHKKGTTDKNENVEQRISELEKTIDNVRGNSVSVFEFDSKTEEIEEIATENRDYLRIIYDRLCKDVDDFQVDTDRTGEKKGQSHEDKTKKKDLETETE